MSARHFGKPSDGRRVSKFRGMALTDIDVFANSITDGRLVSIGGIRSLRRLRLSATAITDAGLRNLRGLRRLCRIDWQARTSGTRGSRLSATCGLSMRLIPRDPHYRPGACPPERAYGAASAEPFRNRCDGPGALAFTNAGKTLVFDVSGTRIADWG